MKQSQKVFALMLVSILFLCSLVGGAQAEKADRPLIGVMFYSNTDALGGQTYAIINKCAETLGCDTLWEVGNFDNDSQLNAIQNLIAAGIDGLVFQPMNYDFLPKVMDVCAENNVFLGIQFGPIQDQETIDYLAESKYFVGYSFEDEAAIAKRHMEILSKLGCSKLGIGYATPGQTLADLANAGFNAGIQEYGFEVLAEYSTPIDQNVNTCTSNVQNFLSSYPEMDSMVFGGFGGGVGEAVTQLVINSGRAIKYSARDLFVGMEKAFEAGVGASFSGATAPDGLHMFACVYNAVVGTPVTDTYVKLVQPPLFLTSLDECKTYEVSVSDVDVLANRIFTADYYTSLSKANNADLTPEAIQDMMNQWSFEWIDAQLAKN